MNLEILVLDQKAFAEQQNVKVQYMFNENIQKPEIQQQKKLSVYCEYSSDDQNKPNNTEKNKNPQSLNSNLILHPFFVKYHGQKIKIKSIALFTNKTEKENIQFKITLMNKVCKKSKKQVFLPIQSTVFSVRSNSHFLELKNILISPPQCCAIQLIILGCPTQNYKQIQENCQLNIKKLNKMTNLQKQNCLLQQIRKKIKKQRQFQNILKKPLFQPIKLPMHFISKQKKSTDEVQTSQILFFKYLAFYEKYNTSSLMLNQQIEHINLQKIGILKQFIEKFQSEQIILEILKQKQRYICKNRNKKYLIETIYPSTKIQQMLYRYSVNQHKIKKQRIKGLEKCILIQNKNQMQHIIQQNNFFRKFCKQNRKKHIKKQNFTGIQYPLLFRDIYQFSNYKKYAFQNIQFHNLMINKQNKKKKKFFIFAHGFQGLPIDLTFLINMIKFNNDKARFIILKSFKSHMNQSIEIMAQKIEKQINTYFQNIDLKQIQPQITFIGHSMGAIILRAALKLLNNLKVFFHSFVSICSPHLGYMQGTKFLTQTGLSIISKLKPIQSLNQLSNRDHNDLKETFIFKLSKQGSLSVFKKLYLISCSEDNYVPWHSARIQPYSEDSSKQNIQKQMISNILGINQPSSILQKIQRIQINFKHQKQKFINSIIGRTCHIKPLNDRGFLELFTKEILVD